MYCDVEKEREFRSKADLYLITWLSIQTEFYHGESS